MKTKTIKVKGKTFKLVETVDPNSENVESDSMITVFANRKKKELFHFYGAKIHGDMKEIRHSIMCDM